MSETTMTPAGAELTIRRSRGEGLLIEIDRWKIHDATATQCDKVRALALREIKATCAGNRSVSFLADPSIWSFPTNRDREQMVLRELFDIELEGIR